MKPEELTALSEAVIAELDRLKVSSAQRQLDLLRAWIEVLRRHEDQLEDRAAEERQSDNQTQE